MRADSQTPGGFVQTSVTTIERFILDQEDRYPEATGELSNLLYDIALAAKIIAASIRRAGLVNILGSANVQNVQGEEQKRLDVIANDAFIRCVEGGGHAAALVSEELEEVYLTPSAAGKYLLAFDPLDGSSNIDVNGSVGSIFSILRAPTPGEDAAVEDFLQPGTEQVCAGYAIYGPTTMIVLTVGSYLYSPHTSA